jgi:hypothetical protein
MTLWAIQMTLTASGLDYPALREHAVGVMDELAELEAASQALKDWSIGVRLLSTVDRS